MFWYVFLAMWPVIIGLAVRQYRQSNNLKKDKKDIMTIVCFGLLLFVLVSFRYYGVGSADSQNYYENWQQLERYSFSKAKRFINDSSMEKGYLWSVFLLSRIFHDPQWLFVFSAILFSISVCLYIYKNSKIPMLSAVLFTTVGNYSFMVQGLRQSIAMSICLFSVEAAKKRRLVLFVFLILLAMAFHKSAFIFLPVYFFYVMKMNKQTYAISFIISFCMLALSVPIANLGNKIMDSEYTRIVDSGGFVATAIYLIIIVLALLYENKVKKNDENFGLFFFMTLMGAVFFIMRYTGALAAGRMSYYYLFGQMILLPNIVSNMRPKDKAIIELLIVLLAVLLFAYRLKDSDLIPYYFMWQK